MDDDDDHDPSSALPDILKPAAPKEDDGKNRGQNRLSAAERKRLKKAGGPAAPPDSHASRGADGAHEVELASSSSGAGQDAAGQEVEMEDGARGAEGKGSGGKGKGATKADVVKSFVGQVAKAGGKGEAKPGPGAGDKTAGKGGGKKDKGGPPPPPTATTAGKRGSNAKKKKLAKYAEQDEDERLAALRMLGVKIDDDPQEEGGETGGGDAGAGMSQAVAERESAFEDSGLPEAVRARLADVVREGKAASKDFDKQTLSKLAEFTAEEGLEILDRFAEAEILAQVKNKAAFLSGPSRVQRPSRPCAVSRQSQPVLPAPRLSCC